MGRTKRVAAIEPIVLEPLPHVADREALFLYADSASEEGRAALQILTGLGVRHIEAKGRPSLRRWFGQWLGLDAIRDFVGRHGAG